LRVMPDDQRFDNLNNDPTGNEGIIEPVHSYESHIMTFELGTRLRDNFFNVPCEILAKSLLGQTLVRSLSDGNVMRCKIVETECYLGGEDKASHSYNGRMTQRNMPMYMKPGTSYVYFTYGMYHCFNISCQGK
jgi:DNA-3-methyladenine glycosylase